MAFNGPRILVIGAGVNGCICAVRLFEAGVDVTLLARGSRYEYVRTNGVVIDDGFTRRRSVTRVPVIARLEPDDVYDYVLVVVRRNQVADLLPVLARNRSPNVVFMVNNVTGPEEWARAIGRERTMLGFVFGAGRREGDVIHGIQIKSSRTPFGEMDGAVTPRLERLVKTLCGAGLKSYVSRTMPDWLTAHAAMVAPIAALILKHDCDTYALGRSKQDLALLAAAMRDTTSVLQATGHRLDLSARVMYARLPTFVVAAVLRALFASRIGEMGAGWHCSQAPDEMHELADELLQLVTQSGLEVPALRRALATR